MGTRARPAASGGVSYAPVAVHWFRYLASEHLRSLISYDGGQTLLNSTTQIWPIHADDGQLSCHPSIDVFEHD